MSGTSAGGQGGADAGQATQSGEGEGTGQGPDVSALAEQLNTVTSGQEELRSLLQGLQPSEQEQEVEADEPLDLSFLEDPALPPERVAQQLGDMLDTTAQRQAQQLVDPVTQRLDQVSSQLNDLQMERQFEALVNEFPEIGDVDTAKELLGTAGQLSQQVGQPELATNPGFIRLVYLAGRAADAANAEGDAPATATLEGAGGAAPGGSSEDVADRIVNARKGRGALPF